MRHLDANRRPAPADFGFVFFSWCQPVIDGFCFSVELYDGALGVRRTGGFAGVNEFTPLIPLKA